MDSYYELVEKLKSLTKRLHDKNESVTKLQERIQELETQAGVLWAKADFWKKSYHVDAATNDGRPELQDQAKALSEANDRIRTLVELREFDFQLRDQLRAKVKYLRKRCNKWFERARMHRSKEKALQKMLDIQAEQVKDLDYWRDACEKSDTILRDLTERNKNLEAQLGDILVKNIDISKTGKVIEDLVKECQEARGSLGIKMGRVVFLEELVGSLYGDGWSKLTITEAQKHRAGNKDILAMLRTRIKRLEVQALKERLKASQ